MSELRSIHQSLRLKETGGGEEEKNSEKYLLENDLTCSALVCRSVLECVGARVHVRLHVHV